MSRVHWLGAGLSAAPGIRRIANTDQPLIVWNRTVKKAKAVLKDTIGEQHGTAEALGLDWDVLDISIEPGDVLVSMLPGEFHLKVAKMCLENKAHFVSSSYLSPDMLKLHDEALKQGVSLVNEVGLDPGIDHLFAHSLVDAYKASDHYSIDNKIFFRSYCGGVPVKPNDFKYKFSWSPVGVLKALTTPAKWIEEGSEQDTPTPWKAVSNYSVRCANGKNEKFEAYPNRDSLPFMDAYSFEDNWHVEQFVRGTLRLSGWTKAWDSIFTDIEGMTEKNMQSKLTAISKELWEKHAYAPGEPDRVVLAVDLEVHDSANKVIWHQVQSIDDQGNDEGSSMARLVSLTVALAVQASVAKKFSPGVQAAPADSVMVQAWLNELSLLNSGFNHTVVV